MGLGGYLTWTAAIREIVEKSPDNIKLMPVETNGNTVTKIVKSPVFKNNPHVTYESESPSTRLIQLNNPHTNYCLHDFPDRAIHVQDKHIIENICEKFGITDPHLKCELYFDDQEREQIKNLRSSLSTEYITIEPHSKTNYTQNRVYPFEKWQSVVNSISPHIQVVQVGSPNGRILKNTTNMTGKTSFREAAGIIDNSKMFLSTEGGLVHASTAVDTTALVIITSYQSYKMVAYPQNINMYIGNHGPCGMKSLCQKCHKESNDHDYKEIVKKVGDYLG